MRGRKRELAGLPAAQLSKSVERVKAGPEDEADNPGRPVSPSSAVNGLDREPPLLFDGLLSSVPNR